MNQATAALAAPAKWKGRTQAFRPKSAPPVTGTSTTAKRERPLSLTMIREGEAPVKATGEEVRAFAEAVCWRLRARGAPGDIPAADWDDVEQNAALVAIETEARYGVPLAGNRSFHATAARRRAGTEIARALSRVSFPDGKMRNRAREWQYAVPAAGCGYAEEESVDVAYLEQPDAGLAQEERRTAARGLLKLLACELGRQEGRRWRGLELMFGIGGEQAESLSEAAERTRTNVRALVGATRRLARTMRQDQVARTLRRLMREDMEDR
jgi:hypothetical protein